MHFARGAQLYDKKRASQLFVSKHIPNFDQVVGHFTTSLVDNLLCMGKDIAKPRADPKTHEWEAPKPKETDYVIGCGPCQPFSPLRLQHKTPVEDHEDYDATFGPTGSGSLCDTLETRMAGMAFGEQLVQFSKPDRNGTNHLQKFLDRVKAIMDEDGKPYYTGIRIFRLDANLWLEIPRDRLFWLLVSAAFGGDRGAQAIEDNVQDPRYYS